MSDAPPGGPRGPGFGSNIYQWPKHPRGSLRTFNPGKWQENKPPEIGWIVKGCIPAGSVCLFAGSSGLGKSLLMLQLQVAYALGKPWLGHAIEQPGRSFGFYCEDPDAVLGHRMLDICKHYEIAPDTLSESVLLSSRMGEDNVLMDFNRRTDEGRTTFLFQELTTQIEDFGPGLVIIDTVAHVFSGNENIRPHATQFVNELQKIVTGKDRAIVLCSHPSIAGMASGTGYSGSTAWPATVRAHMWLKRPKGYDDEAEGADHDLRILKTMKANWGPGHGLVKMRWKEGVFVKEEPKPRKSMNDAYHRQELDNKVRDLIRWLVENEDQLIANPRAGKNYILNAITEKPYTVTSSYGDGRQEIDLRAQHYTRDQVFGSIERQLKTGHLVKIRAGTAARMRVVIRSSDNKPYPNELPGDQPELL